MAQKVKRDLEAITKRILDNHKSLKSLSARITELGKREEKARKNSGPKRTF